MKRKLFSLIILVAFTIGFMPIANAKAAPEQGVTIVLSTGVQTTTGLSEIIARFNNKTLTTASNLQFQVDLQEGTWETDSQYEGYVLKLQAEDPTFDVISMDVIWPADFAASGFMEQLDDVFNTSYRDQFLLAPIEAGTYEGHIYGIPWFHDSAMLYFRTDVLEAAAAASIIPEARAPETWEELHDWSIDIMADATIKSAYNLTAGFVWQAKSYEGLMCDFMEYLGGTGTYTFMNQYDNASNFNSAPVKSALTFMKSLIDDGASPEAVLTYGEEESRAIWQAGNAIFHRNWPYAYGLGLESVYLNGTDAGTGEKVFDVAPMPAKDTSVTNPRTSCLGGWQLGVSKFSEHKTEAKAFALWLTAEEQQVEHFLKASQSPTLKSLYNDTRIKTSTKGYVSDFFPVFDAALPRPVSSRYPQYSEAVRGTINSYLAGSIALDDAVKKMDQDIANVVTPPVPGFTSVALFFGVVAMGIIVALRRKRKQE